MKSFFLLFFRIVTFSQQLCDYEKTLTDIRSQLHISETEEQITITEIDEEERKTQSLTKEIESLDFEISTASIKLKAIQDNIDNNLKPHQLDLNARMSNMLEIEKPRVTEKINKNTEKLRNLG